MIDIDKFITSMLKRAQCIKDKTLYNFITWSIKEQGLEFRDGSISKVEPSIPEIVEAHWDEMLEDKSNPDNLHQYLYGDDSILGKVRAEIKKRYEHHLGCMEGSRDDTYPEISHAHHRVIKDELFEILCFLDGVEADNKKE